MTKEPWADGEELTLKQRQLLEAMLAERRYEQQLKNAAPELLAAVIEIDRLSLVIESAVRDSDPVHSAMVDAALLAVRAVITRVTEKEYQR